MEIINKDKLDEVPENFTGIVILPSETKCYFKNGEFHREDGPAIEWKFGAKSYFQNGKRHRLDGPAFETELMKEWFFEGKEITPGELFEKLTDEQRGKIVFEINEWK